MRALPEWWRRRRTVVTRLAIAAVFGVLVVELTAVDWPVVLRQLNWGAVVIAAAFCAVSVAGAAWNLIGFSPAPLSPRRAALAQLAGTALKTVTPASVGLVAVNARVVHRSGATSAASVLAVAVSQAAQFLVTLVLLVAVTLTTGASTGRATHALIWVAVGAVLLVMALATRPWWWHLLSATARAQLAEVGPLLLATARHPRRCLAGIGGAGLLTLGLLGALWASVRAADGDLPLSAVLVVLLAGSTLGSTLPTPGGVGGVEAAMIAGLVAAGLPLAQAATAVVVYRLLTFWLLVPLGIVAAVHLRRANLL